MYKVLVGQFSFLDIQNDGVHKAIIHEVHGVLTCSTEDKATETGEKLLEFFESYIVLPTYTGAIEYDKNFDKLFESIQDDLDNHKKTSDDFEPFTETCGGCGDETTFSKDTPYGTCLCS